MTFLRDTPGFTFILEHETLKRGFAQALTPPECSQRFLQLSMLGPSTTVPVLIIITHHSDDLVNRLVFQEVSILSLYEELLPK